MIAIYISSFLKHLRQISLDANDGHARIPLPIRTGFQRHDILKFVWNDYIAYFHRNDIDTPSSSFFLDVLLNFNIKLVAPYCNLCQRGAPHRFPHRRLGQKRDRHEVIFDLRASFFGIANNPIEDSIDAYLARDRQ